MASRYGYSTHNGSAVYRSLRLRRAALIMVIYLGAADVGFTFQKGVKTCRFLLC